MRHSSALLCLSSVKLISRKICGIENASFREFNVSYLVQIFHTAFYTSNIGTSLFHNLHVVKFQECLLKLTSTLVLNCLAPFTSRMRLMWISSQFTRNFITFHLWKWSNQNLYHNFQGWPFSRRVGHGKLSFFEPFWNNFLSPKNFASLVIEWLTLFPAVNFKNGL